MSSFRTGFIGKTKGTILDMNTQTIWEVAHIAEGIQFVTNEPDIRAFRVEIIRYKNIAKDCPTAFSTTTVYKLTYQPLITVGLVGVIPNVLLCRYSYSYSSEYECFIKMTPLEACELLHKL